MDGLAEFYVDNAGLIFLAAFAAATIVLMAAARLLLPSTWWLGALISGLGVAGAALVIVLALQGLDTGDSGGLGGIEAQGWLGIFLAWVLGAIAGADVQLAIGAIRGRRGEPWTVAAGAVLGPVVIIGGYVLLVRTMEWVTLGTR